MSRQPTLDRFVKKRQLYQGQLSVISAVNSLLTGKGSFIQLS